jgi:DNA primase
LGSASDGQPKYKNSPETTLYSKRRTLYALNWAKDEAVKQSQIIVCEGYTDVIGCFTSGLPFAVATCGTALAEEHVRLLKKYVNRVVLAYDADGAGQAAAERFYAWEKEFEIDLVVAEFPSGKDPGDLARNNPEQLRAAIAEAKPFLAFRIDRLFGRSETKSPEARARVADKVIELIKEHPNQLVRDQYLIDAADRLRIEPNQLRERLDKGSTSRSTQSQQPTVRRTNVATVVTAATNVERSAVLLTVQHPAVIAELLVGLSGAVAANVAEGVDGLSALAAALFSDDRYLRAMLVLLAHDNVHDAMDQASPDVAELLGQLSVEDEPPGVEQEIADQVADTFALLFVAASRRASQELRRRSIESGETFDLGELRQSAEDLLRADTRSGAMRRLLPWLLVAEGE